MVLVEEGYSDSSSDILSELYESNRTFPENNTTLTNFDSDSMVGYDNMVGHTAMVGDAMMVRHPTMVDHTVMSGCGLSGSHDDCRSSLSSSLHSCSTESTTPSHNATDSPTIISGTGSRTTRRFSSPASYSFSVDTRTNTKGKKTATHVHFDDQTSLHDTTTVAMETDNAEPNGLLEKHRMLMRQSISQGMSAIMHRVVSEPRRRALPSDTWQPQNVTIATALSLKEETVMQPLDSEETRSLPSPAGFQEGVDGGDCEGEDKEDDGDNSQRNEEGEEEEEEEGGAEERNRDQEAGRKEGGCGHILSGEGVLVEGMTDVLGQGELLTGGYVDCEHHEPQRVEENGERASPHPHHDQEASNEADSQSSRVLQSHGPSLSDVRESTAPDCSRQNLLQSYFRTSKVVLFQSKLTVYPTFQAHASLYPSFLHCEYFTSEMDIFQSLSTLMETKLSKTVQVQGPASLEDEQNWSDPDSSALSPERERQTPDYEDLPSPPCTSLISPSRRSRLIDQATRAVKLKYSFNDCPTNLDNISLLSPTLDNTPSSLAPPAHKDMQPLSDLPPSLVLYTHTHDSFPAEELTANFEFHQRQESFPDSCGGHSSVGTLNSRSATPGGSQGSVEMTFSNTQPSRQLSGSSVIPPYHQKSLPSSPHNVYPPSSLMHSQKSLSYLSILQHTGGQAASRRPYPVSNIALHQTFRSTEVLNTGTHREVLCTFGSFRRPLTVLMSNQSKSTLSLSNPWSPSNQTIMDQHHPVFHSTQNLPKN